MKWSSTLIAVVACACVLPSTAGASVDVHGAVPLSYTYTLSWHPRERVLSGSGRVRVENRGPGATGTVWLRLRPNSGDGLERLSSPRGAKIAAVRAGGSMVRLKLTKRLAVGGVAAIDFRVRLNVPTDDSSLGHSAGLDLFGDAVPVVAVAGPDGIRVGPEPSYGEGSFNAVANWHMRLKVPRGLRAIIPGQQRLERGRHSNTYSSYARVRDIAFAIGQFSSHSTLVDGVRVEVVGASAVRSQLPAALRRAVNAFRTLQGWYGGYHLKSLKIAVGDLEFGGSEYPGLVFSTPDNATIAHEVAHQWFYGLVGNDQYADPFLDESLTAWAEQQFHRSYRCKLASPIDGRAHGLKYGMGYWQKHPGAYKHTIYRGGACALTVLRNDVGAAAFDSALRAYVQANVDKIAAREDFLAAVRAAAPWYDLARWERQVGLR